MARHSPVTGRYVTIDVDGFEYKVFYLQNGRGQPLVCQHTAGCHNHQWRGLLEDEEITKNYNVIAYDLARHGKTDPPHNAEWWKSEYKLTKEHYVNFILKFCDALELRDPIFMGSSFGGNVALQLALRHPDRFKAVIPVEAADYAPGFFLDWWTCLAFQTSPKPPLPNSSTSSQSAASGRSPGLNLGIPAGRNGSRSSGFFKERPAGIVVPPGSEGRRSDWRTADGTWPR